MTQEINLYQPIFRRQKKVFSTVAMGQVAAIVALGLLAIYSYGIVTVHELQAEVDRLERRSVAAQQRFDALQKEHPAPVRSKPLEAQLNRLQNELGYTRRIAAKLSSGTFGNTSGLSPYLEGLARQHIDGTWLTNVRVGDGGNAVGVRGRSLAPELVPVYVQRLSREHAFVGKAFSDLELVTDAAQAGVVKFEIRTEGLSLSGGSGG